MPQPGNVTIRSSSCVLLRTRCLLLALLAALWSSGSASLLADDSATTAPASNNLVGARVNVKLRSGKSLKGVTVEEIRPGKISGTVAQLRVTDPATGSETLLGALAVEQVTSLDGTRRLVFDATSKALAPPDAERLAAIHKEASSVAEKAREAKARKAERLAKQRADKSKSDEIAAADEEARRKENEAARLAHFKATGVWLWPELTDKNQEDYLAQQKAYLRKVSEKFSSLNMRLYETQYFLFLTDLSPQWVPLYTSSLDAMHNQLCAAYAIKDKNRVWLGKLPVIAFSDSDSFEEFEKTFFHSKVDGKAIQGLAHKSGSGEVVVSCHCGKDPNYFAAVIVHETTHGFNHRYKSASQLPSWLDEGIADWTAGTVVHNNSAVLRKVQVALAQAKQQGNLGGNFFSAEKIDRWQYGIASSMVNFLLKSDGKAFRKMLDEIKSGAKWQDALKTAYRVTPAELTAAYGRSMGIPNLQP